MPRFPRTALALLALLALAAPTRANAHAAAIPETFTVLTYNVQGLPDLLFDHTGTYGIDEDHRGEHIAHLIREGGYDIVALNEVFDDSMRAAIVNVLKPHYPFIIEKLSGSKLQDSGLMLFSKFPVVTSAAVAPYGCYLAAETITGQCSYSFHMYANAAGDDALSDKGIGFARFRNPATGRSIAVYFTHMQADGAMFATLQETKAARAAQVGEAVAFIDAWSPAGMNEDVLLLGDLNIPALDGGAASQEYTSLIATGGFATIGLKDAWTHTSPEDLGLTHGEAPNDPKSLRLDYMLYRTGARAALCFQHLTLERHFRVEEQHPKTGLVGFDEDPMNWISTELSDHLGLAALVGKGGAPQCSPELASHNPANGMHPAGITHPRSYLWYRFDQAGTYSFSVNAAVPLEAHAFFVDDLSTPIESFEGETTLVTPPGARLSEPVIFAPNGPFYVRLRAQDPMWTGPVIFNVLRHDGGTFGTAIVLQAFEERLAEQMSNAVANPMQKVHFMMKQRRLFTGDRQHLEFKTFEHPTLSLALSLYDANTNPFPGLSTASWTGAALLDVPAAGSPVGGQEQKLYLVADRSACMGCLGTFTVRWKTDYVHLDDVRLKVKEQADPVADDGYDEPFLFISIDGEPEIFVDMGDMDDEQAKYLPQSFQGIGFKKEVRIRIVEDDELGNGADDQFGTQSVVPPTGPIGNDPATGPLIYTESDGGKYLLKYKAWRNVV